VLTTLSLRLRGFIVYLVNLTPSFSGFAASVSGFAASVSNSAAGVSNLVASVSNLKGSLSLISSVPKQLKPPARLFLEVIITVKC